MIEKSCSYFQFMEKNYLEGLLLHKNSETIFVLNPFLDFSLKTHVFGFSHVIYRYLSSPYSHQIEYSPRTAI